MKTSIISKVFAAMVFAAMSVSAMAQQIVKNDTHYDVKTNSSEDQNVYTIRFDLYNYEYVILMPYVGQEPGELYIQRFEVIPSNFDHDRYDYDWTIYFNIFSHGSTLNFTYKTGLNLPSNHYESEGYEVLCGMDFVVYVMDEKPTDQNYYRVISNARYVPYPITLKQKSFLIWETDFGDFESQSL